MSVNLLTEILAAHADQLDRGDMGQDALTGPQRDELESLLDVAARAKRILTPVSPRPAFRAHLREGLTMAAHHQHAHNLLIDQTGLQREEAPWGWLLGAAALGSAAGLIAIALRTRQANRPAAQPVAHESVN